jgi:hypothetical protein
MMVILLLLLGVIAIAAGMFGLGLGAPVKDTTFGAAVLVSASLAITGGFILLGMAAAVYELRRALRAAIRQMRPERFEAGSQRARRMEPRLGRPGAPGGTSGGEDPDHVIPTRFDAPEPAQQPHKPARGEWGMLDTVKARAPASPAVRAVSDNGAELRRTSVPAPSVTAPSVPAPSVSAFSVSAPSVTSPSVASSDTFDTIRPSDYRKAGMEELPQRAAAAPSAGTGAGEDKSPPFSPAEAAGTVAVRPVRILKSGAINDVAYTLFSDGTIEAQTADGTRQFGSIDEFRRHLEKGP